MNTLKDLLADWTDDDIALWHLARMLGLVPWNDDFGGLNKWLWETQNPTSEALGEAMLAMRGSGILLHDEDWGRWKWNHKFDPAVTPAAAAAPVHRDVPANTE